MTENSLDPAHHSASAVGVICTSLLDEKLESDMLLRASVPLSFLSQSVLDASPMKRSASTVTPQRPQEVNLRDYTLEKPSQDRPHHHHHHHRCHHRRDRDRDRDKDREKRQRSLDTPLGGQPPSAG